jgi:pimeloyl-ACP methyl ester carboxylesterase
MDKVISADGTEIAYEAVGSGPPVVLVGGAFCDHHTTGPLAAALATAGFTAVSYDRRGRGESGDTLPYAVANEVEDIAALIARFGGRAHLHGISSGGALCLIAAGAGLPIDRVSVLEPPYRVGPDAPEVLPGYTATIVELTSTNRRGDAVAYFMTKAVGQPEEAVEAARSQPMWPALEAMAHTLAYDAHVIGGDESPLPTSLLAGLTLPVLALFSTASPPWMAAGAQAVAATVPNASVRGLAGTFHEVPAETLAPVLADFYEG